MEQLEDVWNSTEGSTGILDMPRAGKHRSARLSQKAMTQPRGKRNQEHGFHQHRSVQR